MDIIKAYATENLCYIAGEKMCPQGIVLHSTGANNPTLKRYVDCPEEVGINKYNNHWNQPKPGGHMVCVHAFIGYDKNNAVRVAEILPLNICCWGVGAGPKGSYNNSPPYIQIEICEDSLEDAEYYRKAFSVAAMYCAELCEKYEISVDKIAGHCEAYRQGYGCNHADPEHWMKKFGETMDDFRCAVAVHLNRNCSQEPNLPLNKVPNCTEDTFSKGDLVSLLENAEYYNGQTVPTWVLSQNWYVHSMRGDKVIIDKNENGTNSIFSAVNVKYLSVIKRVNTSQGTSETKCRTVEEYCIQVPNVPLIIRKGPGVYTEQVGCIEKKGVYTIVEERKGDGASLWGKLKSGAGWIPLDYVRVL